MVAAAQVEICQWLLDCLELTNISPTGKRLLLAHSWDMDLLVASSRPYQTSKRASARCLTVPLQGLSQDAHTLSLLLGGVGRQTPWIDRHHSADCGAAYVQATCSLCTTSDQTSFGTVMLGTSSSHGEGKLPCSTIRDLEQLLLPHVGILSIPPCVIAYQRPVGKVSRVPIYFHYIAAHAQRSTHLTRKRYCIKPSWFTRLQLCLITSWRQSSGRPEPLDETVANYTVFVGTT